MEREQVKEWLKSAYYAEKKIKSLEILINQLRERAKKYGGCNNDIESMEKKIEEQQIELIKITDDISNAISKLHNHDLETILIYKYLLFYTMEKTADLMHYNRRTILRKHKIAINNLAELFNNDEI